MAAGGNYGLSSSGQEVYGAIASPANDPSVITVGSVNTHGSVTRDDDSINLFSSRGPTRSAAIVNGIRKPDNLLKPDLVAPGNRIFAAAATRDNFRNAAWNTLATNYPDLVNATGGSQSYGQTLMSLSGTSIAAPVVTGAVALMLQANPGLTPPLIKAILQYSAQPLPNANLLQQGAGMLNIDGAVAIAKALRTDIASVINSGAIQPGANLVAAGKSLPAPQSTIAGQVVPWSRIVYAGGNRIVSGSALLTQFQPIWDPRITWAGSVVRKTQPNYWTGSGIAANTYVKGYTEGAAPNQSLLMPGLINAQALLGTSSYTARTGLFMPSALLTALLGSGSGTLWNIGVTLSQGLVMSEGLAMSEGLILSEGLAMSEGLILSEGLAMSEGLILSESGAATVNFNTTGAVGGED